jgi:uncharacterized phosphosugar-binding protein
MNNGETIERRARINVKLASGTNHADANEIFARTPGLHSIAQLFPDEHDDEMRSMYLLEVAAQSVKAAVEQLRTNPQVESVHETAPRRLIR